MGSSQVSSPLSPISRPKAVFVFLLLRPISSHYGQRPVHARDPTHPNPHHILTAHLESDDLNPPEITQIHARLLRTNSLPSSFHWNCLIRAYLRRSSPLKALHLYCLMSRSNLLPDPYTLPMALKAASHLHFPTLGHQLHSSALKLGLNSHKYCETGLIAVYTRSGDFPHARKVFDESPNKPLPSWNALMSGLSQGGRPHDVIALFLELRMTGILPDEVTMVGVLSACGSLGDLDLCRKLHRCVLLVEHRGFDGGVQMWNSLVDTYGRCGRTDLAHLVFRRMVRRNVSSWTAMITAFSTHGLAGAALRCFEEMRKDGVSPNHVTFLSLLGACAHGGLVDEAIALFEKMEMDYGVKPGVTHYGCMVDVLGRVGRLEDAKRIVERMPGKANAVILGTVLGACEKHGNVEVGRWAAGRLIELEPWNDGVYVVLSNIYADAAMWKDVEAVRVLMKERKVSKMPAFSSPAILT